MDRDRTNLKAGVFVTVGAVLAVAVVLALADFGSLVGTQRELSVRFPLADSLKGLKPGAAVTVGGVQEGQVTAIEEQRDDNGVVVARLVRFTLPDEYKVYENATVELHTPYIGTNTTLNISSFGGEPDTGEPHGQSWLQEPGDPPLRPGPPPSRLAGQFVRELGVEQQQQRQIRRIIANVERLTAALGKNDRSVAEIVENVKAITATLRDDLPAVVEKTDGALGAARTLLTDAQQRSDTWFDRIDSITERTDGLVSKIDTVIEENRANLRGAVASADRLMTNAAEVSDTLRNEWMGRIDQALTKADEAIGNIREATGDLKTFVASQRPVLERTIANARITSDQLKLASIEVRRAPWRLLYEPDDKELETENLYDAARSFAMAAGSLDATADSLQTMLDRYGDRMNADDANLESMLDNLRQTFEKFNKAEERFWQALDEMPAVKETASSGTENPGG